MPLSRRRKAVRVQGRRVLGTVVGVARRQAVVLLGDEEDVVCVADVRGRALGAGQEVVVKWHPEHPAHGWVDEVAGDPWLLIGTSAAATVLEARQLPHRAWRYRLDVRPAGQAAVERDGVALERHPPGATVEVLWSPERDAALLPVAAARIARSRNELLQSSGVRAPAVIVEVTDTKRRGSDGLPELVIVTEVRPAGGREPFRIAKRGSWREPKAVGQRGEALFHPDARHLHVLTFER